MNEDDLNDYLSEEPNKGYNIITLLAIFLVAAGLIATAWYIYNSYKNKNDDDIIVITADHDEIKVKPSDPGGMVVDNMDKAVYDTIDGSHKNETKIEIILPPSEEPIDKKSIIAEDKSTSHHLSSEKQEIITAIKIDENENTAKINTSSSKEQSKPIKTTKPDTKKEPKIAKLIAIEKAAEEKIEEYIKPTAKTQAKNKSSFIKKHETFYKVQVASFKSSNEAEKEWSNLSKRFPKLIGIHKHYVTSKNIEGKGIFHRLQVGPFDDENTAHAACKKFKESGVNCFIIKP